MMGRGKEISDFPHLLKFDVFGAFLRDEDDESDSFAVCGC